MRIAKQDGTNAKLSEYHGAVGLAQLKRWQDVKKRRPEEFSPMYRAALDKAGLDITLQKDVEHSMVSTFMLQTRHHWAQDVADDFIVDGIAAHRMYLPPLYQHPHFANLIVTNEQGKSLSGAASAEEKARLMVNSEMALMMPLQSVFGVPFHPLSWTSRMAIEWSGNWRRQSARRPFDKTRTLFNFSLEKVETIVVGAGVIGLAVARALAQRGREVLVLEAEPAIGSITSSRNSGVIHAGIYYKPGSLKARLCVSGRDKLYAYAVERGIPNKRCGKLVVATAPDQLEKLKEWQALAAQNGVDLPMISAAEARAMEPEVFCTAALHSPLTGILDVHAYMLALLGDAEAAGATLALQAPVVSGQISAEGFVLEVGGTSAMTIGCRTLINAAGLGAQNLARGLTGLDASTIPPQVLAKGNYFSLTGKQPFKMLIYPLPVLGSSGLHASCDISGRVRFGPDVEWVEKIDYRVDPAREPLFEEAVRRYWPGSRRRGALQPDYAGIRPKIARGSPHDTDFIIQTEREHTIPGLLNLHGIESPGLTSSLALAEEVAARLAN